jgi:alginate O-acetyltransferase complex protein AlgJ
MKNITNIKAFDKIYSALFSVVALILLISFISSPEISLSSISTGFRWRSNLIDIYTSFRLKAGDHIFNNAVIGEDGWIFYTGELSIPDYQNTAALKPGKLARLQQNLDRLSKDLEEKGITLLVIIPPNKSTIYAQNMPEQIPIIGDQSRLDQFLDYMKKNGNTPILDLRPVLFEASSSQVVYHKTDTHWNAVGAYYGYVATMSALVPDYPMLAPHPISDYTYTYVGDSVRDLPKLMGLKNYTEENWALLPNFEVQLQEEKRTLNDGRLIRTVTNINGQQLPKLLVFGDSFYSSLAYFIEPHFSRVKSIPFTAIDNIWSLDWIHQEDPDIVLIEIVERAFDSTLPLLFDH